MSAPVVVTSALKEKMSAKILIHYAKYFKRVKPYKLNGTLRTVLT